MSIMSESNKSIHQERKDCGCNGISCNYAFQPIDVKEDENTNEQNILRAVLFCQHCTHTEECIYDPVKLREIQSVENAIQEP